MNLTIKNIETIYKLCVGYVTSKRAQVLSACPYTDPKKRADYMERECGRDRVYNDALALRDKLIQASENASIVN